MKPGPKPKPTQLKIIEGRSGRRQLNEHEPHPRPAMPDPPEFLTGYALEEWHRKAPDLHQVGILTVVDDAMLAAYCTAYALWRTAQEQLNRLAEADPTTGGLLMKSPSGYPVHNPLLSIANKARAEMARYAAELGLTPSGRTRVQTEALNPDPRIAKYGL